MKMVCISCFIAPLVLFIWYKFIYPLVQPLINRFLGDYELPQPFANLTCPIPQKNKPKLEDTDTVQSCPVAKSSATVTAGDEKKDL